ncbi:MAG: 50S ribosome-binding GTPase [Candidatus Heimdallarchaeota archaeon]|nr:50S ribosome-binding GTPase [Candidatus Heimdallarchaeota archaeon]
MQDQIVTVRTLECDVCNRFDSITLSGQELAARCKSTDMGIGAYSVVHTNHTRIVYFDNQGTYLGDTIAMNEDDIPDTLMAPPLPYYIRNSKKLSAFQKFRKVFMKRLHNKNLIISIAGPSRAGKTSLVRYMDTLVPERDGTIITSVPTMGKSVKHVKIGSTQIKSLDLGGQEDFWSQWEPAIRDSDAVFFLLDATSNNVLEIAQAFERVINNRIEDKPVLVILNKKDLMLRGEASKFMGTNEFLALTNLKFPIPNVVAIEASVFEGVVYKTVELEEISLAETISEFLADYC